MHFIGWRFKSGQAVAYKTAIHFDPPNEPTGRFCGAMCHCILTEEPYEEAEGRVPAWGYDGAGADRLSAGILCATLAPAKNWGDFIFLVARQYTRDLYGKVTSPRLYSLVCRNDVLLYYRDFTKEHTSKWGDEWTMTSDEVMAWLISKGYKQKEKVVA